MKKLLGIVVLSLLLVSNAFAGKVKKILYEDEKVIIIKEDRKYTSRDFVDFSQGASIAENYCKSKNLNSFYIIGKLTRSATSRDDLKKMYHTWPDFLGHVVGFGKPYRYFCTETSEEALNLFKANYPNNFISQINGNPDSYWSVSKYEIEEYIVRSGNPGFDWAADKDKIENKKIAEKPKKKEPKKKQPKTSPDDDKIVPAGSGSGFFVSKDGHAITNYHVIQGCDINKLSFKGSQTEVKVLAVDKVNDIAILKSNAKPDVIFPVSNEDVSLLEDVIVAGFPLGKQISSAIKTHKGVVTALAGAGDNYSFFQTDAAINQGNSGGPIINQKGNVVGIAVATWVEEGVQGVHFGIKSSTLKTFASANGLSFESPNFRDQSNKALGELITKGTVYIECHMTVAKIKKMIAQAENRKAFFKEHK